MDIKCRACLATTEAKMYHSLLTVFPEYMKTSLSVLDLLKIVTSTDISMSFGLPNNICTACLKRLRDSYSFIEQFKDAQSWLEENYKQELEAQPEKIIIKVETIDEEFSSSVVDMEGNGIFQISLEGGNKINKEIADRTRTKSSIKIRKKRDPDIEKNNSGMILMSIEDILKGENEKTVTYENVVQTTSDEKNKSDVRNIFIHNDHTYQKLSETSNEPNICLMSVKDVLNSTTRIKTGIKRKKTKGILTQSIDLVKNLERKTVTRRTRKQKTKEQVAETNICEICQKVYDSKKRLVAHKHAIHVPEWHEKFKCSTCGLQCRTRSSLVHHKLKHEGKQVKCDKCEKVYFTNTQLKEHKNRIHGNGVPAKYLCTECGKRFKYISGFNYHKISAHDSNNKPYMCLYCGFKCAQKSYLNRHERCHTDERPYKCKLCDKTFRGSAELLTHRQYHERKYNYACQYCDKGFVQAWNMKVHWLQHGGNYDCEICRRDFIDENVLKFHYYHHHKIRDDVKEASEDTNYNSNDEQEDQEDVDLLFSTSVDGEDSFSRKRSVQTVFDDGF